ncbi:uncharacterized protein LOC135698430 [Ochlerotatus camptorhynchus]|uniref:uncharacterized protein LOC135698430 n=1 Tax=Ochlerotatus camptorhynchus TaxID=644619 RepID=UPI0031D61688
MEVQFVNAGVVRLSIAALFLTGFRRDPYPWIQHKNQTGTDGQGVDIDFYPDLYLAQILGPVLTSLLITCNVSVSNVRDLYSIIHPPVCLCYALGCILKYFRDTLPVCSFALEALRDSKVALYFYQIIIYSSSSDRYSSIIYGTVAQSLGNAFLQWISFESKQVWPNTQYFMDLAIAMVHYFLFCPRESWKHSLEDSFEESNRYAFREFIAAAVFGVILLSSVSSAVLQWLVNGNEKPLKPFFPLFVAFENRDFIWNTLFNVLTPICLQHSVTCFSVGKKWIACFTFSCISLTICLLYVQTHSMLYLTMVTMSMMSFSFGMALAHLVEICSKDKIVLLPAAVLLTVHMAMYGFGGLLKLLPKAWTLKNTVLTAVWVINGSYAIALVIANGLLAISSSRRRRRRIRRIIRTIDV